MKNFFAQENSESLESKYWSIWNTIFQLKEYCKLSLFEQKVMTAEEREWYLDRWNKEQEKINKEREKASKRKR